jgi:hypothetical protein
MTTVNLSILILNKKTRIKPNGTDRTATIPGWRYRRANPVVEESKKAVTTPARRQPGLKSVRSVPFWLDP